MRFALVFLITLSGLSAACAKRDEGPVAVSVIGSPDAFAQAKGQRLSPAAQLLRAATIEGLVGFDAEAKGFFWLAGQGGYGFQTSSAIAELATAIIMGDSPESRTAEQLAAVRWSIRR